MSGFKESIICRGCGKAQTWIPIYRRYYCYDCKTYPPVCPECFSDLSWIFQYEKYYCYRCQKYHNLIESETQLPVEQVAASTALLETVSRKGFAFKILNFIDRCSVIVQKAVGGFPKEAVPRSPSIYANPGRLTSRKSIKYLGIGVLIIILTSFFLFSVSWLEYLGLFIFSFIGPVIYLIWMWRTDRYEKEPRLYVFLVFAMGFFTTILAYILNSYIIGPLIGPFSAPIVEEVLKGLCVLWIAKKKEFNDAMDGIVYGFAAGMGFAVSENFFYIIFQYEGAILASVFRVFLWSLGHGLYTGMTGRWLGKMKVLTGLMRRRFLIPGLITAMVMHFIYNEVAGLFLPIIGNIIWDIIILSIVLAAVKQAIGEEQLWGYNQGSAPI